MKRMQNNNIVHLDFKLENLLVFKDHPDYIFKIADLTNATNISDINRYYLFSETSYYYAFPPTYGFYHLIKYPNKYKGIYDTELINEIYRQYESVNTNPEYKYAMQILNSYVTLFMNTNLKLAKDQSLELYNQHFHLDDWNLLYMANALYTKYNSDINQFKTYLFLTVDVYSFGVSLMNIAVHFYTSDKQDRVLTNHKLLNMLHNIIYKCCSFNIEIPDFEQIFLEYNTLISHVIDISEKSNDAKG